MAFQIVQNLAGGNIEVAAPKDLQMFQMTNAQAGYAGRAYRLASGRLTLASGNSQKDVALIAMESADSETPGEFVRCFWILPGMVFKVPCTAKNGSAGNKHSNFVQGAACTINDTGTGADWATATAGGPLTILKVDATNKVAWVAFNSCLLALDTDTQ